jgi:peptidoglycan-associated lipoprotein
MKLTKMTRFTFLLMASPLIVVLLLSGCSKRLAVVKKTEPSLLEQKEPSTESPGLPSSGRDTVVVEDLPPVQESDLSEKPAAAPESIRLDVKDVFFDFDRALITEAGAAVLKENAAWLSSHPGVRVRVEGTTDERGTNDYNLALGEKRATAVKRTLMVLGIPASRIDTLSYGEEIQYCNEHGEPCWSQNRRGHFVLGDTPLMGRTE